MATPYVMHHLAEVGSTQDEAARLFAVDPETALLVYADRQIGGRGRSGRTWWEADRALYASVALRPEWPTAQWPLISLVAGLAARDAVHQTLGESLGLKWPNDLVTAEGKVGGVLAEVGGATAVVGCGLNLWWPDPPEGAAGIKPGDPGRDAVRLVAAAWVRRLLAKIEQGPEAWGHDEYRASCVTLGSNVVWDPDGAGEAVDVTDDGGLVVETPRGRQIIHSGEVRRVRGASVRPDDIVDG